MEVFLSRLIDSSLLGRKRSIDSAIDRFYDSELFDRNVLSVIADMYMLKPLVVSISWDGHDSDDHTINSTYIGKHDKIENLNVVYFLFGNKCIRACRSGHMIYEVNISDGECKRLYKKLEDVFQFSELTNHSDPMFPNNTMYIRKRQGIQGPTGTEYNIVSWMPRMELSTNLKLLPFEDIKHLLVFMLLFITPHMTPDNLFVTTCKCHNRSYGMLHEPDVKTDVIKIGKDKDYNRLDWVVNGTPLDSIERIDMLVEKYTGTRFPKPEIDRTGTYFAAAVGATLSYVLYKIFT